VHNGTDKRALSEVCLFVRTVMQQMRYYFLFVVSSFGILLGGCRERTSYGSDASIPSVAVVAEQSYKPLVNAISSVELIPIEMDHQHLLGEYVNLYLVSDGFLLADKRNAKLYHYSEVGKFINAIGRRGNGPGEYSRMGDIQVIDGRAHLYDNPGRELVYSLSGDLVEENEAPVGFHSYRVGSGLLSYFGYSGQNKYRLVYLDENNSKESGFLELDSKLLTLDLDNDIFTPSADGGVFIIDSYSPTIYRFYNEEVDPYLTFDLGKYSIKESFYTAGDAFLAAEELFASNYGIITGYSESNEYKFVQLLLKNQSEERNRIEYGLFDGNQWLWFSFSDFVEEPMPGSLRFISEGVLYGLFTVGGLKNMAALFHEKTIKNELNCIREDDDEYVLAKIRLK